MELAFSNLVSQHYTDVAGVTKGHGYYHGYHCEWPEHTISIHKLQEGNQINYIYINRGQPHRDNFRGTAMVFTLPEGEAETFEKDLFSVFASRSGETASRDRIAQFLDENQSKPHYNPELTEKLSTVQEQSVANCSVANANIAWHFQMAANYMRSTGCDFSSAYDATSHKYQKLRQIDKAEAFSSLIRSGSSYENEQHFIADVGHVLTKFWAKEQQYSGEAMISVVLTHMPTIQTDWLYTILVQHHLDTVSDPRVINSWLSNIEEHLLKTITDPSLVNDPRLKALINLKSLLPTEQEHKVSQDPRLLKAADVSVQEKLIGIDKDQYFKFASESLQLNYVDRAPQDYLKHLPIDLQIILCDVNPTKYLPCASLELQLDKIGALHKAVWPLVSPEARIAYVRERVSPDWTSSLEPELQRILVTEKPEHYLQHASLEIQLEKIGDATQASWDNASAEARVAYVKQVEPKWTQFLEPEQQQALITEAPERYLKHASLKVQFKNIGDETQASWDNASAEARVAYVKQVEPKWTQFLEPAQQQALITEAPERYLKHASLKVQFKNIGDETQASWDNASAEARVAYVKQVEPKWTQFLEPAQQQALITEAPERYLKHASLEVQFENIRDTSQASWDNASAEARVAFVRKIAPKWIQYLEPKQQGILMAEDPDRYKNYSSVTPEEHQMPLAASAESQATVQQAIYKICNRIQRGQTESANKRLIQLAESMPSAKEKAQLMHEINSSPILKSYLKLEPHQNIQDQFDRWLRRATSALNTSALEATAEPPRDSADLGMH